MTESQEAEESVGESEICSWPGSKGDYDFSLMELAAILFQRPVERRKRGMFSREN